MIIYAVTKEFQVKNYPDSTKLSQKMGHPWTAIFIFVMSPTLQPINEYLAVKANIWHLI